MSPRPIRETAETLTHHTAMPSRPRPEANFQVEGYESRASKPGMRTRTANYQYHNRCELASALILIPCLSRFFLLPKGRATLLLIHTPKPKDDD